MVDSDAVVDSTGNPELAIRRETHGCDAPSVDELDLIHLLLLYPNFEHFSTSCAKIHTLSFGRLVVFVLVRIKADISENFVPPILVERHTSAHNHVPLLELPESNVLLASCYEHSRVGGMALHAHNVEV